MKKKFKEPQTFKMSMCKMKGCENHTEMGVCKLCNKDCCNKHISFKDKEGIICAQCWKALNAFLFQ